MVSESPSNHKPIFVGLSYIIGSKQIRDKEPCFLIMYDLHNNKIISFSPENMASFSSKIPITMILNNGYFGAMIASLCFPHVELRLRLPDQEDTTFMGVTGDNPEQAITQFLKQIKPYTLAPSPNR